MRCGIRNSIYVLLQPGVKRVGSIKLDLGTPFGVKRINPAYQDSYSMYSLLLHARHKTLSAAQHSFPQTDTSAHGESSKAIKLLCFMG